MHARDIMTTNLITVLPSSSLKEAAAKMREHNVGALPVYDGQKLHGIVTDRDLTVRGMANGNNIDVTSVSTVMTKKCVTCSEDTELDEVVNLMEKNKVRRLVVTKHGDKSVPVGIFSLDDIGKRSDDTQLSGKAFIRLNKNQAAIIL
jgi:CBS domain-containing protein